MAEITRHHFLPYLRRGMATQIPAQAIGGANIPLERFSFDATVRLDITRTSGSIDGAQNITKKVELFGPGDLDRIDEDFVRRTDPLNGTGLFEPNYFPAVTIREPDYPWRFTALGPTPGANGYLLPWLTLIVLVAEGGDGGTTKEFTDPQPVATNAENKGYRFIENVSAANLPDLSHSWRWAHVQVTTSSTFAPSKAAFENLFRSDPQSFTARLICARRLQPGVHYNAFVVPTFKLSFVAAKVIQPDASINTETLAWKTGDRNIRIPYFHRWSFMTNRVVGDFESLVRQLRPRELPGIGFREMDCSAPRYGIGTPDKVLIEGALRSVDNKPGYLENSFIGFQKGLEQVLNSNANQNVGAAGTQSGKSIVIPPQYGQWHSQKTKVNVAEISAGWFDELNLDPRHRIAAGIGAEVIRKQQEPLMESALEQAGSLKFANELIRYAQLGICVSKSLYQRITKLPDEVLLSHLRGLHSRLTVNLSGVKETAFRTIQASKIPSALLDSAFLKLTRKGGRLKKVMNKSAFVKGAGLIQRMQDPAKSFRVVGDNLKNIANMDVETVALAMEKIVAINIRPVAKQPITLNPIAINITPKLSADILTKRAAAVPPRRPVELKSDEAIVKTLNVASVAKLPALNLKSGSMLEYFKKIRDEITLKKIVPEINDTSDQTGVLQALYYAVPSMIDPPAPSDPKPSLNVTELTRQVKIAVKPTDTIAARLKSRLKIGGLPPQKVDLVMAAPEFHAPMYTYLRDESSEYICPGLNTIPDDTVGLLSTNRRFIESYMLGLSSEFASELLWREYPTDQRGTYFRQFWDPLASPAMIENAKKHLKDSGQFPNVGPPSADQLEVLNDTVRTVLEDIRPVTKWGKNKLGMNDSMLEHLRGGSAKANDENLVMIIRGALLRKYPATEIFIYREKASNDPATDPEILFNQLDQVQAGIAVDDAAIFPPFFKGDLPPDVSLRGFNLKLADVKARTHYLVLEEHVNRTRFGLDEAANPANGRRPWDIFSWGHFNIAEGSYINNGASSMTGPNGDAWDTTAGKVARVTYQKPVRIVINLKELLPE